MCVRTVEALLVDYGTAGQGFIVLLVTHQGVHTQDGWKTARRLNEGQRKKHTYSGPAMLIQTAALEASPASQT